jgi:hypothetical protein
MGAKLGVSYQGKNAVKVLQRIFGSRWDDNDKSLMKSCVTCTRHQMLLRVIRSRWMRWLRCVWGDEKCIQNFGWKA